MEDIPTPQREISFEWQPLTGIKDLKMDDKEESGVYIWGFTIGGNFIPYYVGIAYNIKYRLHEHINSIAGGRYTIYHQASLEKFARYKNAGVCENRTEGIIYIPDWPYGYAEFLQRRKELMPHIDFMLDNFTFSYACTDPTLINEYDLKELEKNCINAIGKDNLINTRAGYSDTFNITHTGESRVANLFKPKPPQSKPAQATPGCLTSLILL